MVQSYSMMEEEEELEALRIAALQTIRTRKGPLRPIASVTAHRQLEKQSFFRHTSNPNLIAIIPTEPRSEPDLPPVVSVRNGIGGNSDTSNASRKSSHNVAVEPSKHEKSPDKDKLTRVKLRKSSQADSSENKDRSVDKNSSTSSASALPTLDNRTNSDSNQADNNFDEDELDFEGDTVMLHDDDDSLDRLMDEMEQEFSQETIPVAKNKPIQSKSKEAKTVDKTCEVTSSDTAVNKPPPHKSTASAKLSRNTSRPHSPNGLKNSSSPNSSPNTQSPLGGTRKRFSPSPPPARRRSPLSPRLIKRRRASHTPPRRFSRDRSPVRSIGPSKYANRSRSPYTGKRSPDSPRRRNSTPSPMRKSSYRSVGSPPRRRSPLPLGVKRRSNSPVPVRHRRSPRRSPDRLTNQPQSAELKARWKSLHHRKVGSQHKRDFSDRNSKSTKYGLSNQRLSEDTKLRNDKKSISDSKIVENIEKKQKDYKSEEIVDPKFEARRRKFESSMFITAANKKICLKNSDEVSLKSVDKKKVDSEEEECQVIFHSDESSGSPVNSLPEPQNKKSFSKEAILERRVTEIKGEKSSLLSSGRKKTIIVDESTQPQRIRIDGPSLKITTENRQKSLINHHHSIGKLSKNKETKSPETDVEFVNIVNDLLEEEVIEEEIKMKKVMKKKKKNKELKRRKEAMLDGDEKIREKHKDGKKEELTIIATKVSGVSKPSVDLRAELSRRRAERLKGVTNPMARIVQSAFEDVVANRKKFETKYALQDKEPNPPSTSDLVFKPKGNRRVHVLQESSAKSTSYKKLKENLTDDEDDYSVNESEDEVIINNDDEDHDDDDDEDDDNDDNGPVKVEVDSHKRRRFGISLVNHRSKHLRANAATTSTGRSILHRSQNNDTRYSIKPSMILVQCY